MHMFTYACMLWVKAHITHVDEIGMWAAVAWPGGTNLMPKNVCIIQWAGNTVGERYL